MNRVWIILSALLYILLAYFVKREQIELLLFAWGILFVGYFWLTSLNPSLKEGLPFRATIWLGIVFRLLFLFAVPALSDDFYRFVWDGRMLINDHNPFLYIPTEVLEMSELATQINANELFPFLNSPNYYSVYPPLNQYLFGLAAFVSNGNLFVNVIALRVIILLAEGGTLWLLYKLKKEKNNRINITIYALNPLVIIELTGNLHFEAVVIFFLVLAYYLLKTTKGVWKAALALASAISVKLLPLIFMPLIISKLGLRKGLLFSLITFFFCGIYFSTLLNIQIVQNILKSLSLYFQTFEFNGSIYYLVREVGYSIYGYNIIGTAGKVLSVVSFMLIIFVSTRFKKLELKTQNNEQRTINHKLETTNKKLETISQELTTQQATLILTIYLLFATTVHPWYITPLVLMSCFSKFRFPIIWSALIPLTYFSYTTVPYKENLWLVGVEYLTVVFFFIYEWKRISGESFRKK